jgi:4,5-dihydroxyphthalate decarboxylase
MANLSLTLGCGDYDLLRPLIDGAVRPAGIDLTAVTMPSPERHWRMLRHEEFDVCELSMASYLSERARSDRFIAIPVFPHRRFRHSYIFVRADGPVRNPRDLDGRRVGVRTWQTTAGVWVRGMLQHDYQVGIASIHWLTQDEEDVPVDAARRFRLERVPAGQDLDRMLVAGDVDVVIYPEILPSFHSGRGMVRRLFEDYKTEEIAYYQRTGIFPIMHTVVVRRAVLDRAPWVAVTMMQAFEAAKAECYRRLRDPRRISLAWAMHALEEQERVLGPDPWAYGLEPNRTTLEAILAYAEEQGLTPRRLAARELFAPSTLDQIPAYIG